MCGGGGQRAPAQQVTPVETPVSETVRRAGEAEVSLRRRMAGIANHTVTSPLGIPVNATDQMGAVT